MHKETQEWRLLNILIREWQLSRCGTKPVQEPEEEVEEKAKEEIASKKKYKMRNKKKYKKNKKTKKSSGQTSSTILTSNRLISSAILSFQPDQESRWLHPPLITSSGNSNCIRVLISVQYKASSCLLLVLIPDPGILVCPLHQARETFYSISYTAFTVLACVVLVPEHGTALGVIFLPVPLTPTWVVIKF